MGGCSGGWTAVRNNDDASAQHMTNSHKRNASVQLQWTMCRMENGERTLWRRDVLRRLCGSGGGQSDQRRVTVTTALATIKVGGHPARTTEKTWSNVDHNNSADQTHASMTDQYAHDMTYGMQTKMKVQTSAKCNMSVYRTWRVR